MQCLGGTPDRAVLSGHVVTIRRIEITEAALPAKDFGHAGGGVPTYLPGQTGQLKAFALRIVTDEGPSGEYVGGDSITYAQIAKVAPSLIGRDVYQRGAVYEDLKFALRKYDRFGMGPIDIALWDLAGKLQGVPISALLGGWKRRLPAYASTMAGDRNGGLDSPAAFADFAVQCNELGYRAYKFHVRKEDTAADVVRTIFAVREAVGPDMDLMIDPASKLATFIDAVKVGRACDEAGFLWLEDPYRDGGVSAFGHARLRALIRTPLLQTEHVRGLEQHVDFAVAGGTDLLRADPEYDGGITGALKIAHASEGLGLDVEFHAPGPAQRHLMSATRNTNYYEMGLVHPKTREIGRPQGVYLPGYRDGLREIGADGCVAVPEGPGLGVTYDWDLLTRLAVNTVTFD